MDKQLVIFEGAGDGFMKLEQLGQHWNVLVCCRNLPENKLYLAVSAGKLDVVPFASPIRKTYECCPDCCAVFAVQNEAASYLCGGSTTGGSLWKQTLEEEFRKALSLRKETFAQQPAPPVYAANPIPSVQATTAFSPTPPTEPVMPTPNVEQLVTEQPMEEVPTPLSPPPELFGEEELSAPFATMESEPETYYDCNRARFEKLFAEGQDVDALSSLIPGSRWVRGKDEDFITGVIYDGDNAPLYVCYGIPAAWSAEAPVDMREYGQWIPEDFALPRGNGYWVVYQSAATGEKITL